MKDDQYDELDDDVEAVTAVDPDSMSAPDQAEVQQLQTDLDAANDRGDHAAAADLQARLDRKLAGQ